MPLGGNSNQNVSGHSPAMITMMMRMITYIDDDFDGELFNVNAKLIPNFPDLYKRIAFNVYPGNGNL